MAEQTLLLSMGDKTKRSCRLLTVCFFSVGFFFWAVFLFYNIHFCFCFFVFHSICNISQQQQTTQELCYWGIPTVKNINILCTPLRRVDKRISIVGSWLMCFVFLEVELWSAPSSPQPPAGPCHTVETRPRSGKSAPRRLTGSGGGAQLCPALGPQREKRWGWEGGAERRGTGF